MGIDLKKTAIDLGLVTTNGEPMLAFYRDLLGLKLVRDMPMPGGQGTMFQLASASSWSLVGCRCRPGRRRAARGARDALHHHRRNVTQLMQTCTYAGLEVAVSSNARSGPPCASASSNIRRQLIEVLSIARR